MWHLNRVHPLNQRNLGRGNFKRRFCAVPLVSTAFYESKPLVGSGCVSFDDCLPPGREAKHGKEIARERKRDRAKETRWKKIGAGRAEKGIRMKTDSLGRAFDSGRHRRRQEKRIDKRDGMRGERKRQRPLPEPSYFRSPVGWDSRRRGFPGRCRRECRFEAGRLPRKSVNLAVERIEEAGGKASGQRATTSDDHLLFIGSRSQGPASSRD